MITQDFKSNVDHETYVILGNDALLKCDVPSFVSDLLEISGWVDNQSNEYLPQTIHYGEFNRIFSHSELGQISPTPLLYKVGFYLRTSYLVCIYYKVNWGVWKKISSYWCEYWIVAKWEPRYATRVSTRVFCIWEGWVFKPQNSPRVSFFFII